MARNDKKKHESSEDDIKESKDNSCVFCAVFLSLWSCFLNELMCSRSLTLKFVSLLLFLEPIIANIDMIICCGFSLLTLVRAFTVLHYCKKSLQTRTRIFVLSQTFISHTHGGDGVSQSRLPLLLPKCPEKPDSYLRVIAMEMALSRTWLAQAATSFHRLRISLSAIVFSHTQNYIMTYLVMSCHIISHHFR